MRKDFKSPIREFAVEKSTDAKGRGEPVSPRPEWLKPGELAFSRVFQTNVTIWRIFDKTVTLKVWGSGLREGEWITFRGQRIDTLEPMKRWRDLP